MTHKNYPILAIVFALCCTGSVAVHAQETYQNNYQQDNVDATQPDNTQVNVRDRNGNELTADQQQDNESDRSITQRIRRAIIDDKSLSLYAHNLKVISHGGNVTLKGPVRSNREKNLILEKAIGVTGSADRITDQISIKRQK